MPPSCTATRSCLSPCWPTDHGEEFFDHGGWEHGHTLFQELTRIPLIVKLPGQGRGEIRPQLTSISDVAGMILEQYGAGADFGWRAGGDEQGVPRALELSLPVSPFRGGSFGKVSFVDADGQYIHNFLPPATAGSEPSDEWFRLADTPVAGGESFAPSAALHSRHKKLLASYILRLKALKKNRGQLDPELLEKLKALGYLN